MIWVQVLQVLTPRNNVNLKWQILITYCVLLPISRISEKIASWWLFTICDCQIVMRNDGLMTPLNLELNITICDGDANICPRSRISLYTCTSFTRNAKGTICVNVYITEATGQCDQIYPSHLCIEDIARWSPDTDEHGDYSVFAGGDQPSVCLSPRPWTHTQWLPPTWRSPTGTTRPTSQDSCLHTLFVWIPIQLYRIPVQPSRIPVRQWSRLSSRCTQPCALCSQRNI